MGVRAPGGRPGEGDARRRRLGQEREGRRVCVQRLQGERAVEGPAVWWLQNRGGRAKEYARLTYRACA